LVQLVEIPSRKRIKEDDEDWERFEVEGVKVIFSFIAQMPKAVKKTLIELNEVD
jgi:hypothetical protein